MSEIREVRARAADGVEIALHRLPTEGGANRPVVLLMAGTFCTRTFWLGRQGQGFARVLASRGFDVWVVEPRGHGTSERPARWLVSDWIELDAPAAAMTVLAETGRDGFFWIGHSAGGVVGAGLCGSGHPIVRQLRGLVLVGAPGPGGLGRLRRWGARGMGLATRLFPRAFLPGGLFGLGPETEPAALIHEWMGWNLRGAWRRPGGGDYLAGLAAVDVPILAVAGEGDRILAPPGAVIDLLNRFGSSDRTLLVAGVRTGYARDYDHAGLLIDRAARREIWPQIIDWLALRSHGGGSPNHATSGERSGAGDSE